MTAIAPTRFDIVGSFLRPDRLKAARAAHAAGELDDARLKQVEDECIAELVQKQKDAGLPLITDGEFRRSYWHLDFMWGFAGIEHVELDHGYFFVGEETTHGSAALTGKISGENHPFIDHFAFVQALEEPGHVAKQTIPAPAQLVLELYRDAAATERTRDIYPNEDELLEDIGAAYRTVIRDLYAAGCRNLQLDDCTWGALVDEGFQAAIRAAGSTPEAEAEKYLRVNNLALVDRPADMAITTHVCRGNYHSAHASSGPYDLVAPILFARENVDAFYLEFDDERSGGFGPLAHVAPGKKVVLGLVTTKRPELEDKQAVIKRIHEAARYVPLDDLCLSPQCGFASCEIGNKLTEDEQWAKVALVREIAQEVWEA